MNEDLVLRAGEILIAPAEAVRQGTTTFRKTGFRKGENTWEYLTITQVPTIVEAGGNVEMIAGVGDTTIRASVIRSGGSVEIAAEQGAVRFETAYDHVYRRATKTGESAVWQSMSDEGVERQTVVHTEITAPGGLEVRAADGIVVQYRAGLPLNEAIEGLSDLEGLAWMQALRGRDDVDWQAVDEVHRQWQEEAEGLSGPAAVVIAIAIAVATHGVVGPQTVFFANSTLNAAAIAAVNAGFTSLVTQASISLVNNKGDLGGVFDDLSSSRAARAFATSVLVAGLTAGVSTELGIDTGSTDIVDRIRTNLVEAGVGTAVDVTLSGAEFGDSLLDHLAFAAVDTVGAEGAEAIGKAYYSGDIDRLTRYLAHAGLGCAIGAASGECRAGAIGAVAGEAAGELYVDIFQHELTDALERGELTPELVKDWEARGVNLARLAGALAVAVSGSDEAAVNTAADTAENAARENAIGKWIEDLIKYGYRSAKRAGWLGRGARLDEALDRFHLVEPYIWGPGGPEESYREHGENMGYNSPEDYENAATDLYYDENNAVKLSLDDNAIYVYDPDTNTLGVYDLDHQGVLDFFQPDDPSYWLKLEGHDLTTPRLPKTRSQLMHIFRDAPGHFKSVYRSENRQLLLDNS